VGNSNVKIPTALFSDTLYLLQRLQIIPLTDELWQLYKNVFREFQRKQNNMDLRVAYASVVNAGNEKERNIAKTQYFVQKQAAVESLKIFN